MRPSAGPRFRAVPPAAYRGAEFPGERARLTIHKIAIDGFNLSMAKGSGIATYARNLNGSLRRLGYRTQILYGPERLSKREPLLNEIAIVDAPRKATPLQQAVDFLREGLRLNLPFERAALPVERSGTVIRDHVARLAPESDLDWVCRDVFHRANRAYAGWGRFTPVRFEAGGDAPDVVHWTCALPLRAPGRPNLYTLHDLVPLRLPYATLDDKRRYLAMTREICATADRIVTVSEHSRQDLVRILGVDERRVAVTYQAVDVPATIRARAEDDVAREVESAFGLSWRGYFLFFGAIEPKKNLSRVIEAYLAAGCAAPLVIIGGNAWLDEDETEMLYEDLVETSILRDGILRRSDRIRRYEYLPFALLVSLIRGARATLMPSLYEGFGLPVLESMQLGTPVIASTAGSLPEVAGDAALLVDPYDTQAIRAAILALDGDDGLRAELSARGQRQAARFDREAYEARLGDLYRSLAN